jgi:hypothetical protein
VSGFSGAVRLRYDRPQQGHGAPCFRPIMYVSGISRTSTVMAKATPGATCASRCAMRAAPETNGFGVVPQRQRVGAFHTYLARGQSQLNDALMK